jgi:hypothetical protein
MKSAQLVQQNIHSSKEYYVCPALEILLGFLHGPSCRNAFSASQNDMI